MIYNEKMHINNVNDVKTFFHHLVYDLKINFHPDDDFADYIDVETKEKSFTTQDVDLYNRLMDESFSVCKSAGIDIYEIGIKELSSAINMHME